MTEKEIKAIVDQVMKQLPKQIDEKRILILMSSSADEVHVDQYLKDTGSACLQVDKIELCPLADNLGSGPSSIQLLLEKYQELYIAGLTLKQLCRIREICLEDSLTEIIIEALRIGKPVRVISRWLDTTRATSQLSQEFDEIKKTLVEYGLVFVNERGHRPVEINRIDKMVIAKQDLIDILEGDIEIRKDAAMTTTAKNLIEKRGLVIIRN